MCTKLKKQIMFLVPYITRKVVGAYCKRKLADTSCFCIYEREAGGRMSGGLFEREHAI